MHSYGLQQAKQTSKKFQRNRIAFEFFTGSNCETKKTVLENKFSISELHYQKTIRFHNQKLDQKYCKNVYSNKEPGLIKL